MNGAEKVGTGMPSAAGGGTSCVEANRGHCAIALPDFKRQLATGRCRRSCDSGCIGNMLIVCRDSMVSSVEGGSKVYGWITKKTQLSVT